MKTKILLTLFSFILNQLVVAQNEKRIALVVGNAKYKSGNALKNPANDALLMSKTLKSLGFEVISVTDADKLNFEKAVRDFSKKLPDNNVALFYYAGHGVQVDGQNYLIPVDAQLNEPLDCKFEAIAVNYVIEEFEKYPGNTNIVILDACRNNPFRSWTRGGSSGFKAIMPTSGTIIAFATSEGATASDGAGANGLFTQELVKQMNSGQPIESVFKKTRVEVEKLSGGGQSPQEWSKLKGDFFFVAPNNQTTTNVETNDVQKDEVVFNQGNVEMKYGAVSISSEIEGTLFLDGKKMGVIKAGSTDNLLSRISVGTHNLKVEGAIKYNQEIDVTENQTTPIVIRKKKDPKDDKTVVSRENNITNNVADANDPPSSEDITVSGVNLRSVSGGNFVMGSTASDARKNEPAHNVTVGKFAIMKYEVTVAEFKKFIDATGYKTDAETQGGAYILRGNDWIKSEKATWKSGTDGGNLDPVKEYNLPVTFVSWNDAVAYAEWMSKTTGKTWRLPTEAEWEYAAKAGQNLKYAGTDNLEMGAWTKTNSKKRTHPVGQKLPNFFGLYDMSGNVWEWCADYYNNDYYKKSTAKNPTGPQSGSSRVIRGGSWYFDGTSSRVSNRSDAPQNARNNNIGFRLVVEN